LREGTEVGWGALTVAVAVSHGIGGDPARDGSTGAAALVAFVADAELAVDVVGEAALDAGLVAALVGVALVVGEAAAPDDVDAVVPDPFEQPAMPAVPARNTSAMPAPPRRAPIGERTAVTGVEATARPRVYRGSGVPCPLREPRRIRSCCLPSPA
jgi:hypothetical protein